MVKFLLTTFLAVAIMACNSDTTKTEDTTTGEHDGMMDSTATSKGGSNHMKNMHDAISNMMQAMKSMNPTGDPDYDFAMMMKHHHEGAVEMARVELEGGTNAEMKSNAQKTIDEQKKEISEFDKYLQSHKSSGNSDFGKKAMGMMTPMESIKMESGSLDAMYASMMIPHHQDAINISKEYLKSGKSEDIRKLANDIIRSQQVEINDLQEWLNKNK